MSNGKMTSYVASHHEYGIDHLANSVPVRKSNIIDPSPRSSRSIDHFRYVNDKLLAGIVEGKELGIDGEFYFYLKRNPL